MNNYSAAAQPVAHVHAKQALKMQLLCKFKLRDDLSAFFVISALSKKNIHFYDTRSALKMHMEFK